MIFDILAGLFLVTAFCCHIIILIDAFKDSVAKGIIGLLCGLYLLWYAIFDFDHENKWVIVLMWLCGGSAAGAMLQMAHH